MKLLIALTEGEAKGDFDGRHIFLDGTPLLNADGTENFPGVRWEYRSGTQDQTYIKGFPSAQNEIDVSTELKYGTPWVKAINNTQLSAINLRLKFPNGLYEMRGDGVKDGWRVDYAIDIATDGGAYVEVGTGSADGIANPGYEQSYRIDLPAAESNWQIRVRRLTQNSTDGRHADTMQIASMTEVIDAKFRYPHTALLYIEFDSRLFDGRQPTVTVLAYGRIVRVPSNYDPVARTYTGVWDGTFKWAWTNNPAWVYYDIILSERFGLGNRLSAAQIDKWSLYQIAQYCDDLVPDGYGGMEPRFFCDLYIQSQADAWTLLMDIASIFRGSISWSNNLLSTIADMPGDIDPDLVFNRSNVIGSFNFAGSTSDTHYSTGLITYSDPKNQYQDDQEPVFVYDLVKRFGIQPLEMSATGCTRPTEAQRRGLWAILTNDDDNAIDFKTGLEGLLPGLRPGKIFGITNAPLAGKENGGRISAASGRNITVDRDIDVQAGDRLIVNLPTGKAEGRTIESVNGRKITVTTAYSVLPEPECVWVLDQENLAIEWFRAKRISDNNDNTFTINGLPYNVNKYARIDTGAVIEDRPTSIIPPSGQTGPSNIVITSASDIAQGLAVTTMFVSWDKASGAVAYEAQWRQNSGNWINVPRVGSANFSVPGIYAGRYQVRVRAISAADIFSIWVNSDEVRLTGKEGAPPKPVGFRTTSIIFGITLNWDFPPGAEDTLKTEVQYSLSSTGVDPQLLTDVPYPQRSYTMPGLAAGRQFWFRARLVDRTGNVGAWVDWLSGISSSDAGPILEFIGNEFLTSETGKELTSKIESNTDAIIENSLANSEDAITKWAHYGENRAGIIEVRRVQADADKSFAEYQQAVTATFNGVNANITDVRTAQATTNDALAEFKTQTGVKFGEQDAIIQTKATTVFDKTGGQAIWSVKAGINYNGNYYDAGMVIGLEVKDGVAKSQIGFNADTFILTYGLNGAKYIPFAMVNGQVFINDTFIAKASIGRGKITDTLDSDNYVQGISGLHLDFKNGNAEFNNVSLRGNITMDNTINGIRTVINNLGITTYHSNGQVAVKLGYF
ncbi:host specificity protein [Yersinia kristensenii]|nr:host specificity protein [Yersinia kristensenii]